MQPLTKTRGQTRNSAFSVYKNDANQVLVTPATAQVHFTVKTLDLLNEFSTTTWLFTARKRGLYLLVAQARILFASSGLNYGYLSITTTGLPTYASEYKHYGGSAGTFYPKTFMLCYMNVGDTARVDYACTGADNQTIIAAETTYFAGRRIL